MRGPLYLPPCNRLQEQVANPPPQAAEGNRSGAIFGSKMLHFMSHGFAGTVEESPEILSFSVQHACDKKLSICN